jgi:VRR-NUC domain
MATTASAVPITEKAFMAQVIQLATVHGWYSYHAWDSRRSQRGFPDLVLVLPPTVLCVELKRRGGRLTREQSRWLQVLQACPGVEAYVWTPDDWPVIERRLAGRRYCV